MSIKRLRVFAGPNGSGKTTILKKLSSEIPFGVYVNADDIEKSLKETGALLFDNYQLIIEEQKLKIFFKNSNFSPIKRNEHNLWEKLKIENNTLRILCEVDSYLAADLADFIRISLLEDNQSFTFETVMSHDSKINFLEKAKQNNYRIYLYYSATEDPIININRVRNRVALNGHFVNEEKIRDRYFKSLQLLKKAIKISDRAYIWDNSSIAAVLIAEITNGSDIELTDKPNTPTWFINYVLD